MSSWTVRRILQATGGQLVSGEIEQHIAGISIDSRRLMPGEAYVAIQGHRLDGHA